jgi:hypothetical protein
MPRPAVAEHRSHGDPRVGLRDVLVDPVLGEARERVLGRDDDRLSRIGLRERDHPRGELTRLVGIKPAHRPTPTRTPRNRAGEAPCATCAICIGSPLPQFGNPHTCQWSREHTASHEFQNFGVMPV